ncbi:MAG: endonuclease V [Candidatus Thermoplasmatota archaeon]|nr:endonuclease V [Candidatus Thermoplasmatota archaeon]
MNLFEYTYQMVRQIPPGKISTYGAVAEALGDRVAARAVGRMMNQNPNADDMPCYKIVHSDGRLGGFGLGIDDKIRRLKKDSIHVKKGKIVDFDTVFFNDFDTGYPLKKLRQEQIQLSKKISLQDENDSFTTVAGVDVAYPDNEFKEACGACVVLDYHTRQVLEEVVRFSLTDFPFISTYFSYRELPIVQQLVKKLRRKPSLLLLDGNGILHPAYCGLASHAGILLDIPTVGIAKTLLYGTLRDSQILIDSEQRGYAYSIKKGRRPVYVSPGHRVSLSTSVDIVRHLCITKIPEPLRRAHQLAQEQLHKGR